MMQIICHPQMGPMLTQDFAIAKHNLYFQNLGIYGFCKMSANLSYDQVLTLQWPYKCQWSWLAALYKGKGSVNKLHLLATSLTSSKIPIQHSHTEQQVTLTLSCWLTALQHTTYFQHTVYYSILCTTTYHIHPHHFWWQQCFFTTLSDISERFCVVFLAPTQLRRVR